MSDVVGPRFKSSGLAIEKARKLNEQLNERLDAIEARLSKLEEIKKAGRPKKDE